MFYKIPPEGFVVEPNLYAFTNNKKYKDKFIKQRDMSKFMYKKIEDISKDEYFKLVAKYRGYELHEGTFKTVNEFDVKTSVTLVCTYKEEESTVLSDWCDLFDDIKERLVDAQIFKEDYIKALGLLEYFNVYLFYNGKARYWTEYYEPVRSTLPDFRIDELKVFLKKYGNTFK